MYDLLDYDVLSETEREETIGTRSIDRPTQMFMTSSVKEGMFGPVESGRLWTGLGRKSLPLKCDSYREKLFPTLLH
jgi:hypothetical protein